MFGGFPAQRAYLSREPFSVGQLRDFGGLTLLHWAIAGRASVEVTEYLLNLGIDVNSKDRWDCSSATPLHFAAQLGLEAIADLLIERGADLEAETDSGTPLHWAISGPGPRPIVFISDRYGVVSEVQPDGGIALIVPSGWTADPVFEIDLFQWSKRSGVSIHRRGSDVANVPNIDVVYVWPAPGRNLDTIRFLLDKGADVTASTPYGLSPLHLASIPGCECEAEPGTTDETCPSLALMLIEAGADINSINEDGHSVLDLAECPRFRAELINREAQPGCSHDWDHERVEK